MTTSILPGSKGEPLPNKIVVIRLAKLSTDSSDLHRAHPSHFSLSTADEASELQALSVWARDITPPATARALMGENRAAYRLALHLKTEDIRSVGTFLNSSLDIVWDPDPRPGAGGHSGIIGLMRPPGGERKIYKALRAKLAEIASVEVLSAIEA